MAAPKPNEADLFNAARRIGDPEARRLYVRQACAGDRQQEARIAALLRVHDQEPDFLEGTPEGLTAVTADQPLTERPGTVIGAYKLLEQIGEGGFGVVFRAEQQQPIRRAVALKVLKAGLDTRQVIARFEAERQALALMDHPNIGRVLDGGATASGRPYFVMELVKGAPITRYCDEQRLTLKERLELFVAVCQAVQHAHQKGIIHRDLKPSNVLVAAYEGRPVPKLIDFGVAKAIDQRLTEQTTFTQYGQIVGTLEYMSPEQAEISALGVDTRGDIYSLGVLLYELLTGSTPFERLPEVGLTEMLRTIKEKEPPRPSARLSGTREAVMIAGARRTDPAKLAKLVRGELDWIVMKALEKDRGRRYATANGLARDIERYLADEMVEARPPSAGYRLRKFARRNRGPVIAASLVLLALVAGVIGTTLGLLEANRATEAERQATRDALEQKRLAEQAAGQEGQAKAREAQRADGERKAKLVAEARRQEAERNLTFARRGNEILGSVFAGLDPKQIAESGRPLQDVLRENLGKAVQELEGSAIGDPLQVAAMQNTLGSSLVSLGEYGPAVEVLRKALKTRQAKLGPDDPLTLTTMNNLAAGYHAAGKLDLALPLYGETFKLRRARFGPDDPGTLTSMSNLAFCYKAAGKLDLALPLFELALKIAKARLGRDHPLTLTAMNNLALGYEAVGKLDLALPLFEQTLKLSKAKRGPEHPDTLTTMNNLAACYQAAGKLDLALPLLEETLTLRKAKLGPDHPDTLTTMENLAAGYHAAGKLDKALSLFEQALTLQKLKLGPDHPSTLPSMNNLALGYHAAGKLDLALPLYEEGLKLQKAKLGPDHPTTLITMNNLAAGYQAVGKLDRALALYEESLRLTKAKLGPDHPSTLSSMNNLAMCYRAARQLDKAVPLLEEALKLQTRKIGRDHPDTLTTMGALASGYHTAGRLDLALPLFAETLKLQKAKLGPDHPNTLTTMNNLAWGYQAAGKLDLALPLLEETLKLRQAKLGPDHPDTLDTMDNLAVAYWRLKRLDQSIPLFEMTVKFREKTQGRQHTATLEAVANLGVNYKDAGRPREAIPLLEEAHRAARKDPELRWVVNPLADAYAKTGETAKLTNLVRQQLTDARKAPPKDRPDLAAQFAQLGMELLEQKEWSQAEPLLRECLTIRAKTQPDAWTTFNTQSALGGALLGRKKYADAEPLLLQGYQGMKAREKKIPPQAKDRLPEALDRLIELYTVTNRPDEAKQWRAERAKYPSAKN
jgi:serine/threonine protein kinase/Tfp pilus assembly protein PilF